MATAIVIMVSAILAALTAWGAWRVDQQVIRANSRRISAFYATIAGTSVWTIAVTLLANFLQVPGYFGPVEYVPHDSAMAMTFFYIRAFTFVTLFLIPLIAGVVYSLAGDVVAIQTETKSQRHLIPAASLIAYAVAWIVMMDWQFFPTV